MISSRTETFILYANELVSSHIVKNFAEIADKLEWNRSMLSGVMQRKKNVPDHIFVRFMEVYFPSKITNPLQFLVESHIKLDAKIDTIIPVIVEILSVLKKEDVYKLTDDIISIIESKISKQTKELL